MSILRSFLKAVLLVTATVAITVPQIDKHSAYKKQPILDEIFTRVQPIHPDIFDTHVDPTLAKILAYVRPRIDAVSSHSKPVAENIDYRLPKNVIPINYTIQLEPHLVEGNFTFNGETTIDIEVKEKVTNITVHTLNLTFSDTSLVTADGKKTIKPTHRVLNEVKHFLTLEFGEPIVPGNYKLKLKYIGILGDELSRRGFYRSSYKDENNATVFLAVTHFESTHARQAFPCFDEPALKSHFKISIKHFKNYTALSNMPAIKSTKNRDTANKVWTHFEVTPLMSTYLVAFAISDYEKLSNEDGTFNIWAKRNDIKNAKYALKSGQEQLKLLEEYMGSKHVLPKMDNFAIPGMGGAMENWGLVTYGEQYLIYDETAASMIVKEYIAPIIAHEFAHQWFGNLVTPTWWEHTWLKEGFATYFESIIPDKMEPSWRLMDQFVIWNIQSIAFAVDDNEYQHAMSSAVESPSDITRNYDQITYTKAACVIRMFSHITGEKAFQKGLHQFLEDKKYSIATPDDLFDGILSAVKNSSLKNEMKQSFQSWVTQAGYPVVNTNHAKFNRLHITSKRYLSNKSISHYIPEKWWIPINFATEEKPSFNNTNPDKWLVSGDTLLHSVDLSKWYIINKQQTGYYRVNYDLSDWKLLAKYLRTKDYGKIHVLNRAQLLDDSFNLAKSGDLDDYEVFFDISTYLEQECDMVPWDPAFRAFIKLDGSLKNTNEYDLFKQYIVKLVAKLEQTIGYSELPQDTALTMTTRLRTIHVACIAGSKNCRVATHKDLVAYINGDRILSDMYRNEVLCGGMRSANTTIWNKAFEMFEKKDDTSILKPLGCSSDSGILKSYLEKVIVPESKISKHAESVLNAISEGSAAGIDIAFEFVTQNLEAVNKTVGNEAYLSYYLVNIARKMNTKTQVDKLRKFIQSLSIESKDLAEKLKIDGVGKAEENIQWNDKYKDQIGKFLETQKPTEPTVEPLVEPPVDPSTTSTKEPSEPKVERSTDE